jgi:hypothetical protein
MSNSVSRWVTNVFDAGEKLDHAAERTSETKSGKKQIEKEETAARGQAWGAILQNRTYDEQGKIKGTQANHHVTDSSNHTKPVTPAPKAPAMPTKPKPAVGTDKSAKKKFGSASHNNGYTN